MLCNNEILLIKTEQFSLKEQILKMLQQDDFGLSPEEIVYKMGIKPKDTKQYRPTLTSVKETLDVLCAEEKAFYFGDNGSYHLIDEQKIDDLVFAWIADQGAYEAEYLAIDMEIDQKLIDASIQRLVAADKLIPFGKENQYRLAHLSESDQKVLDYIQKNAPEGQTLDWSDIIEGILNREVDFNRIEYDYPADEIDKSLNRLEAMNEIVRESPIDFRLPTPSEKLELSR